MLPTKNYVDRPKTKSTIQGRIQGGGAHPARSPPKIGKNMIFWRKIVIFLHEIPQKFSRLPRQLKKYDFLE
jgi:hypothetical protein